MASALPMPMQVGTGTAASYEMRAEVNFSPTTGPEGEEELDRSSTAKPRPWSVMCQMVVRGLDPSHISAAAELHVAS